MRGEEFSVDNLCAEAVHLGKVRRAFRAESSHRKRAQRYRPVGKSFRRSFSQLSAVKEKASPEREAVNSDTPTYVEDLVHFGGGLAPEEGVEANWSRLFFSTLISTRLRLRRLPVAPSPAVGDALPIPTA